MMRIVILGAVLALGGCASGGHCTGEFDYQKAESLPPAPQLAGIKQPESPSALRVPPAPAKPVPFAERVPDPENPKDEIVRCLDVPPPLPIEPAATPAPAKS